MNHKEQRATELKEKRPQAGYCGFYNRIIKRIIDFREPLKIPKDIE